jgi:hypothetical protein
MRESSAASEPAQAAAGPRGEKLPHWYNHEDKDQLRSIFCRLEKLLSLQITPNSRMIREFVGSVLRKGVCSYNPFSDFSILTVCKDRTQWKEQDELEHTVLNVILTWDEDGLPRSVKQVSHEPTLLLSLSKIRTVRVSTEERHHSLIGIVSPAAVHHAAFTTATVSPTDASTSASAASTFVGHPEKRVSTSFSGEIIVYPELLCVPKYPRAKQADVDYLDGHCAISSASNKDRFLIKVAESREPSSITFIYASGMRSTSNSADSITETNFCDDFVLLPRDCHPGLSSSSPSSAASTMECCPWGLQRDHSNDPVEDADADGAFRPQDEDDYLQCDEEEDPGVGSSGPDSGNHFEDSDKDDPHENSSTSEDQNGCQCTQVHGKPSAAGGVVDEDSDGELEGDDSDDRWFER